jgi:hypothetical protein
LILRSALQGSKVKIGITEFFMRFLRLSFRFAVLAAAGLALSACGTTGFESPFGNFPGMEPSTPAEAPARYKSEELVGNWGVASYRTAADRPRAESAARRQCAKSYPIALGPNGGVMMHQPNQSEAQEMRIKTSTEGKTFIGPAGEPGGLGDREITSFDGRVLALRYVDPVVARRFGTLLYVRCAPRA